MLNQQGKCRAGDWHAAIQASCYAARQRRLAGTQVTIKGDDIVRLQKSGQQAAEGFSRFSAVAVQGQNAVLVYSVV